MHDALLAPATLGTGSFSRYFHACAFFHGDDEEHAVLGPFLQDGIARGEKAIYIVDPAKKAGHCACLAEHGVDVGAHPECLVVLDWDETYLTGGAFDQDRMLAMVEATVTGAMAEGYPRTRIIGEMGWAMKDGPPPAQILSYEVRVNDVLSRYRHPAICVYDARTMSGEMMMQLLRVHPLTVIGHTLYENPFYVPPSDLLAERGGEA